MPADDVRDDTVVVVPLKAFDRAKARLSAGLDPAQRRELAESMAATVLEAARGDRLGVIVVTDDDHVEAWALARGAEVTRPAVSGLDAAAAAGVAAALERGAGRVVVAHADLPHAVTFAAVLAHDDGIVLVADRHGDGTNVIGLPVDAPWEFRYGPGSFERHCDQARSRRLLLHLVDDPTLAWDVDGLDDLPDDVPRGAPKLGRTAH